MPVNNHIDENPKPAWWKDAFVFPDSGLVSVFCPFLISAHIVCPPGDSQFSFFSWWSNPLHVRSVHIEGNIDQLDLEITLEISYPAKPKRPGWANTCGVKVEFAQYGIHEAKGIGSESRIHLNQP